MKATGVIRRIDDLGRIVIPKEIRKNLRIKNGESLEIFTDENDNIILKKYSQIDKLKEIAKTIVDAVYQTTKTNIIITNTDKIIAATKQKKDYQEKELDSKLINIILNRKETILNKEEKINIINTKEEKEPYLITPIISNGDVTGSVIITDEITEESKNIIKIIASFLGKHIEE